MAETFWEAVTDATLRQGEYLPNCPVPVLKGNPSLGTPEQSVEIRIYDLIIVTQSCDFEMINPELKARGRWEQVRKGRVEGLYLLSSLTNPNNNREALVVDFGEIHSVPFNLLADHVREASGRWRLKSPYLEHFSQAFARFFMRVGLPSSIPLFK